MKKIILAALLTCCFWGYSAEKSRNDLYDLIARDRAEVIENVKYLKENRLPNLIGVLVNVISADEALRQIGQLNQRIDIDRLFLIFPDVKYVDKYIEKVSKNVGRVGIVLVENDVDDKYFEDRDYELYIKDKVNEKVSKLENVTVYKVKIDAEDAQTILINSLTKSQLEDEMIDKYINTVYEEWMSK